MMKFEFRPVWKEISYKEFWGRFKAVPPVRTWEYGYLVGKPLGTHWETGEKKYLALFDPFPLRDDCFFKSDRPLTIDQFQREMNKLKAELRDWRTGEISWMQFASRIGSTR